MCADARWDESLHPYPETTVGAATASASFSTEAMLWLTMLQQFEALRSLQDGWDEDDARAPSGDLLNSVRELLDALEMSSPAPTRILPMQNGGVVIEWRTIGRYLEFEIEDPCCGEIMDIREGAKPEHYLLCWGKQDNRNVTALRNRPDADVSFSEETSVARNAAQM